MDVEVDGNTQDGADGAQGADDSAVATDGAAPATAPPPAGEDAFLTDQQIMDKVRANPDLDHVFRKMQAAYTRKTQGIAKVRDAASIVDRFNSDPDFARQTILQRAQQLGLQVGGSPQAGQPQAGQGQTAPPQLVEAVRGQLGDELKWMAPMLAASQWAGMQDSYLR